MNDELQEILDEFFTEADESLDDLEQDLIKLETISEGEGEKDGALIDRIFRVMHTLKGGAGFLGLDHMARLAHAGESLLDEVRGGKLEIEKAIMDALLESNDSLKDLLEASKAGDDPGEIEIDALIVELERLTAGEGLSASAAPEAPAAPAEPAPEAPTPTVEAQAPVEPEAPVETPVVEEPVVETPAPEAPAETSAQSEAPAHNGSFDNIPDLLINEELLAEIKADDRLDESRDKDRDQSVEASAPAAETPAAPATPEVPVEAPAPEAPLINEELLAEIKADDRLDESLDKGGDEPVEAAKPAEVETPAPEVPAEPEVPVEAPAPEAPLINEELLAEIKADDRLAESLDKGGDDEPAPAAAPAAPEQPAQVEAPAAEPVPAAEADVVKRGEKPVERRAEKTDRRAGAKPDRRNKSRRTADSVDATIRVEVSKLDNTMNLVGELVLARNSLVRQLSNPKLKAAANDIPGFESVLENVEHLSRVTKDLQMSVLSTRMQPIKKVFDKIPRQVRELKNKLGKELDLIIEGEMTEVDKSLVEELADPMVHLIRNSLDHGIEIPADREAIGKSGTGTLAVRAFYEGNKVVIQIADDGKGIDPEKIKQVAINKGVIDEYQAASLSDKDAVRLIMAPGFSTAETISDVSGRGVGMDVVNSKIQAIKGNVDIESEFGVGTTISIYLPLTLAIMQALIVQTGYEGFAIPIGDISEVIKFRKEDVHKVNEQDVIELRGEVLPLYYLDKMTRPGKPLFTTKTVETDHGTETQLAVAEAGSVTNSNGDGEPDVVFDADSLQNVPEVSSDNAGVDLVEEESGYVIVVKEGNSGMGVVADKLLGQEEAVVKPITEVFDYNPAISGATISGDGIVHMILDIPYLIKEITH